MRDPRERLWHILDAIERIEQYASAGRELFDRDELVQNWMVRHIQIIGEAARNIPKDFRDRYPEIPWLDIIDMRHVLVHDYFGINLDIVWRVVSVDAPELKDQIASILRDLGEGP